jgi:uncharacterized protein YxjI
MSSNFFETSSYFIDEKVNMFKFENAYKVYNGQGELIGSIVQRLTAGQKLLRLLLNKAMLPFRLDIMDSSEQIQASITRGWTFVVSKINVLDASGEPIAVVKQKFKFLKPEFLIFHPSGQLIASIKGDWKAWNFTINDNNAQPIGMINKKWAGAMKELFTTADKYNVSIDSDKVSNKGKIAIVASAITIDMVLKESK